MKDECLFCKIIRKEIPGKIVYEDESIIAFMDAYPDTDGHTLVVPKKHYEDIYQVPEECLNNMFKVGKEVASKLMDKLDKDSLTFLINYGNDQAIKHIHLHLLPNFSKKKKEKSTEEVFEILTKE